MEAEMEALSAWENYYVIVGSSAAGLTGLMFVVITLVAGGRQRSNTTGVSAFSTPTVVHFAISLFIAALLSAPWTSLAPVAVILGIVAVSGLIYLCIILRRLFSVSAYQPVFEDWLFHAILPVVGYSALLIAAILLQSATTQALFAVASFALLLIFIGIHNAWDTVTYLALSLMQAPDAKQD